MSEKAFHVERLTDVPVEAAIIYGARECATSVERFREELEAEPAPENGILGRRQAQFWSAQLRLRELIPVLRPLI